MAAIPADIRNPAELERMLTGRNISEIVLLDTSVLFYGEIMSQFSDSDLRKFTLAANRGTATGYAGLYYRNGVVSNKAYALERAIKTAHTHIESCMQLTEAMLDWSERKQNMVFAIPDLAFYETKRACQRFFAYRHRVWNWVLELNERKKSLYVNLDSGLESYGGIQSRAAELGIGLVANNMRDSIVDLGFVCMAQSVLANTSLEVGIVSDNVRDFNALVKQRLQNEYRSEDGRFVKIYNSTEMCDRLRKTGVTFPKKLQSFDLVLPQEITPEFLSQIPPQRLQVLKGIISGAQHNIRDPVLGHACRRLIAHGLARCENNGALHLTNNGKRLAESAMALANM